MDSIIAAVQRVVNALGKIFGWEMVVDKSTAQTQEDTEGIADAWDDATGAAKKYAKQLLGIDELNNLTTNDGSGSGSDNGVGGSLTGGGIIEPGGISFEKIESDIDNLYDLGKKISEGFRNLLPDDWSEIYEKARGFGSGLADFLNGLIQPETFYKLGQTVAGGLNTIAETIIAFLTGAGWAQYKDSFVAFFEGLFDEIHISTIGLIVGAITIKGVGRWIFEGGAVKALGGALGKVLPTLAESISNGGGIVKIFSTIFGGLSTGTIIAAGAVAALSAGLGIVFATNENVRKSFFESISTIKGSLTPAFEFIGNTVIPNIVNGFKGLMEILSPLVDFLKTVFVSLWQDMINPTLLSVGEDIIPPLSKAFEDFWNNIIVPVSEIIGDVLSPVIDLLADALSSLWKNAIVPIVQGLGGIVLSVIQGVIAMVQDAINICEPLIAIIKLIWDASLKPLLDNITNVFKPIFSTFFKFIGDTVKSILDVFRGLIDFIFGVFTGDWEKAWEGVKGIFVGVFNGVVGILEGAINQIINGINAFLSGINWATSGIAELTGKDLTIKTIEQVQLKRFANGGFPNQGSLFVAGETYGQSEWVGNINGRTGVVSGNEITGIADAIYSTSSQEMALLRQQNEYLLGILNKEFGITRNQIGKEAQGYAKEYYGRTGRQAYQF